MIGVRRRPVDVLLKQAAVFYGTVVSRNERTGAENGQEPVLIGKRVGNNGSRPPLVGLRLPPFGRGPRSLCVVACFVEGRSFVGRMATLLRSRLMLLAKQVI
jgi:hypothetical protein